MPPAFVRASGLLLFLSIARFPGQLAQFVRHQPFGEAGDEGLDKQFRHVHRLLLWLLVEKLRKGALRRVFWCWWVKGRK